MFFIIPVRKTESGFTHRIRFYAQCRFPCRLLRDEILRSGEPVDVIVVRDKGRVPLSLTTITSTGMFVSVNVRSQS